MCVHACVRARVREVVRLLFSQVRKKKKGHTESTSSLPQCQISIVYRASVWILKAEVKLGRPGQGRGRIKYHQQGDSVMAKRNIQISSKDECKDNSNIEGVAVRHLPIVIGLRRPRCLHCCPVPMFTWSHFLLLLWWSTSPSIWESSWNSLSKSWPVGLKRVNSKAPESLIWLCI